MTIQSFSSIFISLLIFGCTSRESQTNLTNDSLNDKNEGATMTLTNENVEIPKDYCTIRTNYKSFDFPPDKDFTWTINGHNITVDSLKEFKVKTHPGLDTIIFNNTPRGSAEIIFCDLTKGERYEIHYNSCCSDFNFWKAKKSGGDKRIVEFQITRKSENRKLIGGVSFEAAFLNLNKTITLSGDYMRSPMFPNRYNIFVQEFQPWHEDSTIARIIDPVTKKELRAFKDLDQKLIDFQYIFLDNDRLSVLVDSEDRVKVERVR